jgi:2-haloacid dehalogenase
MADRGVRVVAFDVNETLFSMQRLGPALDSDKVDEAVLAAFRQLDPHLDLEPALRMLHDVRMPAATLTNGSADLVGALLSRAGLDRYV